MMPTTTKPDPEKTFFHSNFSADHYALIFNYLDNRTLMLVRGVCKNWLAIASDLSLWKHRAPVPSRNIFELRAPREISVTRKKFKGDAYGFSRLQVKEFNVLNNSVFFTDKIMCKLVVYSFDQKKLMNSRLDSGGTLFPDEKLSKHSFNEKWLVQASKKLLGFTNIDPNNSNVEENPSFRASLEFPLRKHSLYDDFFLIALPNKNMGFINLRKTAKKLEEPIFSQEDISFYGQEFCSILQKQQVIPLNMHTTVEGVFPCVHLPEISSLVVQNPKKGQLDFYQLDEGFKLLKNVQSPAYFSQIKASEDYIVGVSEEDFFVFNLQSDQWQSLVTFPGIVDFIIHHDYLILCEKTRVHVYHLITHQVTLSFDVERTKGCQAYKNYLFVKNIKRKIQIFSLIFGKQVPSECFPKTMKRFQINNGNLYGLRGKYIRGIYKYNLEKHF